MKERYYELGVAGYLDPELEERLDAAHFDVDAFHSIGIAGPVTPELLGQIVDAGVDNVASTVHSSICDAVDPDDLASLLSIGLDRIRYAASAHGPFDSAAELLEHIRANA